MKWCIILALLIAAPASAQTVCDKATCGFTWTQATGPVAGYEVWAKRGTATTFTKEFDTPTTTAQLVNGKSEQVIVKVRAYATDVTPRRLGPDSAESDPVSFLAPLGAAGKPAFVP